MRNILEIGGICSVQLDRLMWQLDASQRRVGTMMLEELDYSQLIMIGRNQD